MCTKTFRIYCKTLTEDSTTIKCKSFAWQGHGQGSNTDIEP
jgi:hypothetical protein